MTKFYRKQNPQTGVADLLEVGSNRRIGPTEFGRGEGFQEEQQAPQQAPSPRATTPFTQYKSNQKFIDLVKQAIQKKQGFNKDIQSSRDYWRTQQRDPMTLTDERLQLLSPAKQQSLREKRYATAGAHMQGLAEEEKYRGTRLEDVIGGITDLQKAEVDAQRESQLSEGRRLDIAKKKEGLGYTSTPEDIYGSYSSEDGQRVGDKQGGSAAWRNNNPGNIKYSYGDGRISGFAQSLLDAGINIQEGSKATDGGSFIAFPDVDSGDNALKKLLTSEAYSSLSIDEAMKKWSGGGYGSNVMKNPISSTIGRLSEPQLNDLISGMKKREGWSVGKTLKQEDKNKHVTWTEAAARGLAEKTDKTSTDLWNNYTDAELDQLAKEAGTSLIDETAEKLDTRELLLIGLTDKNLVSDILTLKYEIEASDSEIEAFMRELGIKTETKDGKNVLEELDYLINE